MNRAVAIMVGLKKKCTLTLPPARRRQPFAPEISANSATAQHRRGESPPCARGYIPAVIMGMVRSLWPVQAQEVGCCRHVDGLPPSRPAFLSHPPCAWREPDMPCSAAQPMVAEAVEHAIEALVAQGTRTCARPADGISRHRAHSGGDAGRTQVARRWAYSVRYRESVSSS